MLHQQRIEGAALGLLTMPGRLHRLPEHRIPHPLDGLDQPGRARQGSTSSSARRVASSRSARFTGSDLFTGFRHSVADMLTVIASTPTQSASVQSLPVLEARSRAFARRSSAARDSAGLVVRCCFDPVDGFIREKEAVRS